MRLDPLSKINEVTCNRKTIAITGANSYVGSILVDALKENANVIRMLRSPSLIIGADLKWSLEMSVDEMLNSMEGSKIDTLIHVAWDMKTSKKADIELICVQGSQKLLDACRIKNIKNLLFISTVSSFAEARSNYGRSKFQVENLFLNNSGAVVRLGLVYGARSGGMYGALRNTIAKSKVVPMIGCGGIPQYLLSEQALIDQVKIIIASENVKKSHPITLFSSAPITFRNLLLKIAKSENKDIILMPIPWFVIYAIIRIFEFLGIKSKYRSDSVLSFVFYNKNLAPVKIDSK